MTELEMRELNEKRNTIRKIDELITTTEDDMITHTEYGNPTAYAAERGYTVNPRLVTKNVSYSKNRGLDYLTDVITDMCDKTNYRSYIVDSQGQKDELVSIARSSSSLISKMKDRFEDKNSYGKQIKDQYVDQHLNNVKNHIRILSTLFAGFTKYMADNNISPNFSYSESFDSYGRDDNISNYRTYVSDSYKESLTGLVKGIKATFGDNAVNEFLGRLNSIQNVNEKVTNFDLSKIEDNAYPDYFPSFGPSTSGGMKF